MLDTLVKYLVIPARDTRPEASKRTVHNQGSVSEVSEYCEQTTLAVVPALQCENGTGCDQYGRRL